MKTDLEILLEVKKELSRFNKKLEDAINEHSTGEKWPSHRCLASAKRGALDLKNELSKLTQSARYKYDKKYLK